MAKTKFVSKKTKLPLICPHPVNNNPCTTKNCTLEHGATIVRAWKQRQGREVCRSGQSCNHAATGTCLWSHPPAHRNQTARVDEMTRRLRYEENIDVGVLAVEELQTAGITQDRELASFNKVSDSEIAVPGWSLRVVSGEGRFANTPGRAQASPPCSGRRHGVSS